ncbi:MAG TPA: hypothetical protein VF222_06725 [Nitrososphaeraceae archaeon]
MNAIVMTSILAVALIAGIPIIYENVLAQQPGNATQAQQPGNATQAQQGEEIIITEGEITPADKDKDDGDKDKDKDDGDKDKE